MVEQYKQLDAFWRQADENGISNLRKTENAKVIRRLASTDKNKSYEASDGGIPQDGPLGMVVVDGKLIGFGIHIFNKDVYPLQSFEIYLRGCDLVGDLDLSNCTDMVFVDVYNNRISSVQVQNMPSLRILGLQNNKIAVLDPTELPACQGIDVGKNCLERLDVSMNTELVELYVNDNHLTEISLANNPKLKYFYCHNNGIKELDTRR
ncbi:MAG: leucine-rich repeat domain-containing protein, partial [Ruminiclostridium sp.]|nr:leucine-rich repeat domain-containing protein [Ruminiclostridium sp.]